MALTPITVSEAVGTDMSTSPTIKAKINLAIADVNTNTAGISSSVADITILEAEKDRLATILDKAVDYQMLITDGTIVADGNAGTVDITLPKISDDTLGKIYRIVCLDNANAVRVLSGAALDKINTVDNFTFDSSLDSITIQLTSATEWSIIDQNVGLVADITALQTEETRQKTVLAKTANYQMLITDGIITADGSGGTVDITLPDLAVVTAGVPYTIICLDKTNAVRLVSKEAADKINGADSYTYITNRDSLTVIKISSTQWIIIAEVENV